MVLIWDAKNNFILLHAIYHYQQQSLTSDINWLYIVHEIQLEISSTPNLLQNQYEDLLKKFHFEKDSQSILNILKHQFLNSLCQQIEDNSKSILEIVYEFIRHIRAKRINQNDIEQLIQQWNFNYSSDQQKKNLFNILNRLRDYSVKWSNDSFSTHFSNETNSSVVIRKETEEMEIILQDDNENSTNNKQNQIISNINKHEKSSVISRRRTRSLSIINENPNNKINIGIEWFVPKFRRQQRSSSLHDRSQSPIPINSVSLQLRTIITTTDNDESLKLIDDVQVQQTQTKPIIFWQPLTNKQILDKEHRQLKCESIDLQDLEQISSTDSDSIEIQSSTSSNYKISQLTSVSDLHENENNDSCKRQRLNDDD